MPNAGNRILDIIKKTNINTISELVSLTVKSVSYNPFKIILTDGDKLMISNEFIVFSKHIDTTTLNLIKVGDKFRAIILNDGQVFYITEIISSTNELDKYIQRIKRLENIID